MTLNSHITYRSLPAYMKNEDPSLNRSLMGLITKFSSKFMEVVRPVWGCVGRTDKSLPPPLHPLLFYSSSGGLGVEHHVILCRDYYLNLKPPISRLKVLGGTVL
ncbi:hypothetical protein CDAR_521731 [Caerostris darwini]|uniref:Uncharacterized protein n=1 Tax=Caerostris darwini TaxID=1538125 RepID=A0AAV4MJP3_9ARAC|nr:hypothetical protein CDAR_521731 [Caerostris darwini]